LISEPIGRAVAIARLKPVSPASREPTSASIAPSFEEVTTSAACSGRLGFSIAFNCCVTSRSASAWVEGASVVWMVKPAASRRASG
jgi:hypothetical protein